MNPIIEFLPSLSAQSSSSGHHSMMQPSWDGHLDVKSIIWQDLHMRIPKYIENVQELILTVLRGKSDLSTLPPTHTSVSGNRTRHLEMVHQLAIFNGETEQVQQEVLCHVGSLIKPLTNCTSKTEFGCLTTGINQLLNLHLEIQIDCSCCYGDGPAHGNFNGWLTYFDLSCEGGRSTSTQLQDCNTSKISQRQWLPLLELYWSYQQRATQNN